MRLAAVVARLRDLLCQHRNQPRERNELGQRLILSWEKADRRPAAMFSAHETKLAMMTTISVGVADPS
ncbi:hypothetical protein DPM35_31945 [Mesorhizobium atlanticum]|uniref:Uncharacterized protein n=1 Tax=Mesorhizobium atlanticum TaxID=2233532 RepID=A0A330GDN5_9HYPH|nr:hypothetical protein DPM35_31945 [Mesorhizobium atlanticum]